MIGQCYLKDHINQSLDYISLHHPYTGIDITGDFNKMTDSHLKRMYKSNELCLGIFYDRQKVEILSQNPS